jgi:hypothetical protein
VQLASGRVRQQNSETSDGDERNLRESQMGYLEVPPDYTMDPAEITTLCVESGARAVLLDAEAIPAKFFDLSSGFAGELLHRFNLYGIRLAGVVPDPSVHSDPFQRLVSEVNRGKMCEPSRSSGLARGLSQVNVPGVAVWRNCCSRGSVSWSSEANEP